MLNFGSYDDILRVLAPARLAIVKALARQTLPEKVSTGSVISPPETPDCL